MSEETPSLKPEFSSGHLCLAQFPTQGAKHHFELRQSLHLMAKPCSYFSERHSRSTKTLSAQRPLPSMLI
jgi:hypothetical protein